MADSPGDPRLMQRARREARQLHHEFPGTEPILLALLGSPESARLLGRIGVDPSAVGAELRQLAAPRAPTALPGALPFTPGAKQALELAAEEARARGRAIEEGHLLHRARSKVGAAPRVLRALGVEPEALRAAMG